jgi:hypothetical protein
MSVTGRLRSAPMCPAGGRWTRIRRTRTPAAAVQRPRSPAQGRAVGGDGRTVGVSTNARASSALAASVASGSFATGSATAPSGCIHAAANPTRGGV